MSVAPRIITALDYPYAEPALALAQQLDPTLTNVKVGNELFTSAGPALVEKLQKLGFRVFLDLKFHDIPNTVAGGLRSAASLGVWMVNVHACGGQRMLQAARDAVPTKQTLLIAVTVLTSMDQSDMAQVGIAGSVNDQVLRLAKLTRDCGLDGVVCSAQESSLLKAACGQSFLLVTPGVRPENTDVSDQRRIMTPQAAIQAGSDYLVIGRPITQAAEPLIALESIVNSLDAAGAAV